MVRWPFSPPTPRLELGTIQPSLPLLSAKLAIGATQIATHKHVIGVSGMGKSKLLESIYLQLLHQGIGVSFIDPNGDSCEAILALLLKRGFFDGPDAYRKLLYIEFAERDHFLPLNILSGPRLLPQTLASNVVEAFHRCWPALDGGAAPRFDNLMKAGCQVLIANGLPITAMHNLLTRKAYREELLTHVGNPDIVAFFVDRFDEWSKREAPQMIESTLSRIFLLTDSDVLKYSLGQLHNLLDFREIMDQGICVLYNLSRIQDEDAQRLLGALLTRGYESAAISRSDIPSFRRRQHHLMVDEFANFSAQSEEALSSMLSQTRKFELFSVLSHQTYSQASEKLKGALQNVGVKVAFRVGPDDARYLARSLGSVDPERVKAEALINAQEEPKNHPVYLELQAQWYEWEKALQDAPKRHSYVKVDGRPTVHMKTITLPSTHDVGEEVIERIKREYRLTLMRPQAEIGLVHQRFRSDEPTSGGMKQPEAYKRLYRSGASSTRGNLVE